MGQFEKLKKKFDEVAKKDEKKDDNSPAWVTKLVDDLRAKKPNEADSKKALEEALDKNVEKDGSDADKKKAREAAVEQISKEMKKQQKDHPEDASFLKDQSKLLETGFAKAAEKILDKTPLKGFGKKFKIPGT